MEEGQSLQRLWLSHRGFKVNRLSVESAGSILCLRTEMRGGKTTIILEPLSRKRKKKLFWMANIL